jgi:cell fate (sporulation/competence/biofilm development) regulator YlbF (YheA/YmcA/DUF963 family)
MATAEHLLNFDSPAKSQLDMASLLLEAYALGDLINNSDNTADYVYWKSQVEKDQDVQLLVAKFNKAKDTFAECERFGRFHPDFNAAKDTVKAIERQLDEYECVRKYKAAETALDELLYSVSKTIADAVSETIKVPSNEGAAGGGGCGSGGSCSCGSGGCG